MASVRWCGVGQYWNWAAALVLALSSAACGSDSNGGAPGAGGADEAGGAPGVVGEGGAASPVTPGDLVCKRDDDCTARDKPVCDQVLGCVACQYDWDCPAGHRCDDNECFAKQACADSADCERDALHPVCDAVQQLCVGCREDADCGTGERCDAGDCVAFQACTNSRDCQGGKVCSRAVGACVGCVADGDCGAGSACVNDACVPTCTSDKDCLGVGLLCDQQVSRCVECLGHQDCPESYFCAAGGRCTLDVCERGQTRCETEQQLGTCSEVGDAFIGGTCAGDTRCVEQDAVSASCEPLACPPGGTACSADGSAVERCSADGLEVESTEPCGQGRACASGACADVVCTPNGYSCADNKLYACNASGTAATLQESCGTLYVCDAEAGDCVPRECDPGQPVCEGNFATVCDADGVAGVPGGEDCAATDKACLYGLCRPKVCNGSHVCDGAVLRQCLGNGTQTQFAQDCEYPALCDAIGGKCLQPTCAPGAFVCNGNVATRCKADGSGYEANGVDCSLSDQVCDGGGCLPKACTPSASFCAGGSPLKCSASGATYQPTDTCSVGEYCSEGSSVCLADKCAAGAAVCNGNLATTCASDGSGPIAGGTDCSATQQVCDGGACKPVTCTPGVKSCQGEAVYTCNASGTGTTLSTTCSAATFCDASTGTPQCATDLCVASSVGCNGEVISTCGANGGSWTNPGTDCKVNGQVCVVGGTCAAEEVSTQGTTTSFAAANGDTILSAFRALSPRKLTKLETYGSFAGLQKLTWVVYERRATGNGDGATWDLVYQKVTAQTMPTAGYIASPPLDFTLAKGKSYALGVHISGESRVAYVYSSSATYLAKGSFFTAAQAPSSPTYGQTQPPPAVSLVSDYYYRYFVRFTTAVAP